MKDNFYIVLMAGGSGTRLWPMSRKNLPKQFHKFSGTRSLLQGTFDRIKDLVPIENIYVSSLENIKDIIEKQLPEIPKNNFILEPVAKNTGPAFALVSAKLFKINPKAIVSVISTDHTVSNISAYQKAISQSFAFVKVNPTYLTLIGIKPERPDTGFGYINVGRKFTGSPVYDVKKFVEKPDLKTAIRYLKEGTYYWNASYFTFEVSELLKMYEKYAPDIYRGLKTILKNLNTKDENKTIHKVFDEYSAVPIDVALAEKVKYLAVVPAENLGWSDVGSWASLYDFLKTDKDCVISQGHHIGIDNQNCLIYAQDKLLATIGLKDIIVVDTPDVTLICHKDKSQDVKVLLQKLKEEGKTKYL